MFQLLLLFPGFLFAQEGLPGVTFSEIPGFFKKSFELELFTTQAELPIHYTTDGSIPGKRDKKYRGPIKVRKTTVFRARVIYGNQKGEVATATFFVGENSSFPVIALATEPKRLFDEEKGLFRMGPDADSIIPYYGANFWSRKEIPMHTEVFEAGGERVLDIPAGMRMFGGMSRLFPQKSMAIVARDKYGPKRLRYSFFPYLDVDKFKYVALRNSGSDWGKTHLKDAFITYLVRDFDVELQAFRPSHVYINGKYWGIYNIREKVNRFFLASHTGYHKDSVELIEHRFNVRRGNGRHYRELIKFIEEYDLSYEEYYEHVLNQMDVSSFMDLQIVQIYFDNKDAGGNIKYWRPNNSEGKWRWILYDTDWGMGLHEEKSYRSNTLALHTEAEGPSWPNPPWSTFLLRNLLENQSFRNQFINRFCDRMNTTFKPKNSQAVLDSMIALYQPEIDRHLNRWDLSESKREDHLARMQTFLKKRPGYMRRFLKAKFELGEERLLSVSKNSGGKVILNDHMLLPGNAYEGMYFQDIPVQLSAQPYYGYRFVHWRLPNGDKVIDKRLEVELSGLHTHVEAVFEPFTHPMAGKLIINEISVNNPYSEDWVELYNNSNAPVNLFDWHFLDTHHEWELPDYTLGPYEYMVMCEDTAAFRRFFPYGGRVVGNFPFGLNKVKERLQLFTAPGAPIDSLSYVNEPVDSVFTLSLLSPALNNAHPENWVIHPGPGTPNAPNPSVVLSTAMKKKNRLTKGGAALVLVLFLVLLFRFRPGLKSGV